MIITRYHDFSAGHRISGHPGKCHNLHGHNYRVHFHIDGEVMPDGMVVDFDHIKIGLCGWLDDNWDHRFLVWEQDPDFPALMNIDDRVVGTLFNPTAENMAQYLLDVIGPHYSPEGVDLVKVVLEETRKCSAIAS